MGGQYTGDIKPAKSVVYGLTPNNTIIPILNTELGASVVIDPLLYRQCKGLVFMHAEYFTIPANSTVYHLFRNDEYVSKMWFELEVGGTATGDIEVSVMEGATVSDNGTEIALLNSNRNHRNDILPAAKLYHAPIVTDEGEAIYSFFTEANFRRKGISPGQPALILDKGVNYLYKLTNTDTSNDVLVNFYLLQTDKGRWS